jgi:glycosyltransferase involved in cell wall biosynthesis
MVDIDSKGADSGGLVIAHVMGYYMPGLGYQENFLPFEQQAVGNQVHIITGDRYAPHPAYASVYGDQFGPRIVGKGEQIDRGVLIHRLPVPFELTRRNNPWIGGLSDQLNQIKPDIIHLHGVTPLSSLQTILSGKARQWTLVCDHHLCQFNLEPFTLLKRIYYATFRLLLSRYAQKRVTGWLPINEDARMVLASPLGISGTNVHINRLGVDTNSFQPNEVVRKRYRNENGISPDQKLIIFAGKVEPRKRLEDLLIAVATAFPGAEQANAILAIFGGGDETYLKTLGAQAGTLGIQNIVRFHPMQPHDQLPAIFNAADIGVWPGDAAITAIEALSCGLHIILPSNPGLSYVANCSGATEFPRGNTAALAKILASAAGVPGTNRNQIATSCANKLGWQAIARDSISIYKHYIALQAASNAH